jgi:phycocyanobilin lyase beta subunit
MSDSLTSLINAVEAADSAPRLLAAVENLAASRLEGAVPTLIEVLGFNNPGAAVAAVEGLVAIGAPAVPALMEQLDRHNYTARSWTIRALAGIGDPRGLVTLLGAATADFSFSVRRAAARGLGTMNWHWFPLDLLDVAQEEALEALLFVAQQDEEWVVRYSAVVGLEALARAIAPTQTAWLTQIQASLEAISAQDDSWAVRARVWMAQKNLAHAPVQAATPEPIPPSVQQAETDWQSILTQLYQRKGKERQVIAEGDPRKFRDLAVAIAPPAEGEG